MLTVSAGSSPAERTRRLVGIRSWRWLLLIAVAVLAACGSDDPADPASGSDTTGADVAVVESATEEATTSSPSTETTQDTAPATSSSADEGDVVAEPTAPDELPLPTTAADLAIALDQAERALRQPGATQEIVAPWGRRQQALYRVLAFRPEWADEVIAGVDPSFRDAVALNWTATQELLALVTSHTISDTLPAWRIDPPAPADELLGYYRESEATNGVPWSILASINLIETRMGRITGVSTAGAIGPMQFLPTTWAECCDGDPADPRDAINGAGRYLVQRGGDRDLNRAIFGYNNSDHYVAAVTSFAAVLDAEPDLYYGYHAWQVYFLSTEGVIVLPEGYEQTEPIPAVDWLAAHPESRFPQP